MTLDSFELVRDTVKAFARAEVAGSVVARDRELAWDRAVFQRMGQVGLLGACLGGDHGGWGWSFAQTAQLMAAFAEGSGDAGLSLSWHGHLVGCAVPIAALATIEHRRRCLPQLARGELIGALAHHEHHVEGDRLGLTTTAARRGHRWRIRGTKACVINGAVAALFVVTARVTPREGRERVMAFLVRRAAQGLSVGPPLETPGLRTAGIASITLDDVEVSQDDMLGGFGPAESEPLRLLHRLDRGLSYAPWIGLLRSQLDRSIALLRERVSHGRRLSDSQAARATLADLKIRLELAQRLQERSAAALDEAWDGADRDIATARLFLSRAAVQSTQEALRLGGLEGLAGDRTAERLARDAPIAAMLGGGDEVVRSVVAGSLLSIG
jgi:alkylation response protein AidB-like acyl-CoA dehydrogenase